jgi:hypothetical protein
MPIVLSTTGRLLLSTSGLLYIGGGAVVAPVSSYDPDSTAATPAAVNAILASWESNWAGTVPAGKTISDTRVVQLTAPATSWTMNGYDFSAVAGVIVRGDGPYADGASFPFAPTCGTHITNDLTISSCNNLSLALITCGRVMQSGNTDVSLHRVSSHSEWDTLPTSPSGVSPPQISGSNGTVIRDSLFAGYGTYCLAMIGACDTYDIEGTIFAYPSDDFFKNNNSGTTTNPKFKRNWFGRMNLASGLAHSDLFQQQAGNGIGHDFWGNVYLAGEDVFGVHAQGGFFMSTTSDGPNAIVEHNILCMRGGNAINAAPGVTTGSVTRYNTMLYCENGAHGSTQGTGNAIPDNTGSWETNEFNFSCRPNTGSPHAEGTGGVSFVVGDVFGSDIVATVSGYATYFDGFPAENDDITQIKPKVGSAAHWDFGGQKIGGWARAREIWVDKIVPGMTGWPVAGFWHREYDPTNSIGTTYTGAYDDNGENVAAAPGLFDFELVDEVGSAAFTSIPALRVQINGGAWQTIAAAGLTLSRTAADEVTVIGFASNADALSAKWHYQQEQPGEPYSAQDSVDAIYAKRVGGPVPANTAMPGLPISATVENNPVSTT